MQQQLNRRMSDRPERVFQMTPALMLAMLLSWVAILLLIPVRAGKVVYEAEAV